MHIHLITILPNSIAILSTLENVDMVQISDLGREFQFLPAGFQGCAVQDLIKSSR